LQRQLRGEARFDRRRRFRRHRRRHARSSAADAEITLVDRRNHHIFQPLLYQVATAVLSPSEIAAPIRQLEAKQKNLSVLLAEVKGIDLGARTVEVICRGLAVENSSTISW